MKLVEIAHHGPWDAFLASQPYAQFPQSWAWGEFRASDGCPVRRFMLLDERGDVAAAIQMEYRRRRFGTGYWFAPRGPVFSSRVSVDRRRDVMTRLCEELLKLVEFRRRTLFWRMEPVSELGNPEGLVPLSFRRTNAMNPASTILLDLAPSHDDLLRRMHEKTRYNIRVAEKHGVTVRIATPDAARRPTSDLGAFLKLMDETAARGRFIQHSPAYLAATYEFLSTRGMVRIRLAEKDGKVLAANLEIAFGDTVTYLYGATSSESRNVMAPYLLHWNAITDAKQRGFKIYDFWGANPEWKGMFSYKPSWEGITRFKKGWGGRLVNLVGTWDLPFNGFFYRLAHLRQFFRD